MRLGLGASTILIALGCGSPSLGPDVGNVRDAASASDSGPTRDSGLPIDSSLDGARPSITVMVSPPTAHLAPGASISFTAIVTGTADTSVSWTIAEGDAGGTISSTGDYTAPTSIGTYHVVATSHASSAATGSANVLVASVGDCVGLPSTGAWQSILPTGVTDTDGIVVDPFDPATVWVGARDGGIFRSDDCGATWTHVSEGRNSDAIGRGQSISLIVDPVHPGVMYTTEFEGSLGLWKSTNGGVDWDPLFPPESEVAHVVEYNLINSIGMEARDTNHLVVSMHALCRAPYGPVCIAETTDAGATWRIITVPIGVDGWVAGAGVFLVSPDDWLFTTYSNGLWRTSDRGATWTNITPAGSSGSTSGKTIILPFMPTAAGNYYLAAMEGVLQSSNGLDWSLIAGSGGPTRRTVGIATGNGHVFASDQWSSNYQMANEGDLSTWSAIDPPPGLAPDAGAPYLAYDAVHHILYSSNWAGGLWRTVVP